VLKLAWVMIDVSEAARLLAARRKPKPRTCPVCGGQFEAVGGRSKYCSKRCANRAYWQRYYPRHREEYLARQRERQRERYHRQKAQASGAGEGTPPDRQPS